jgi:glycerophosphoryl diester phosphodiesterase
VSVWQSAGVLVVGHRGGRGPSWPRENTLPAFERARAEGARAIELDVRTCATGEVVVLHDPTTASLAKLRGDGVPTLAEALDWATGRDVAVNVEMKHDVPSRVALVARLRPLLTRTRADVLLSSFDPLLLAAAAFAFPAIRRALLTSRDQRPRVPTTLARLPFAHALHLQRTQAAPAAVARYRGRDLRVGVWTVNDPVEATRLAAIGVETLITDTPGALLADLHSGQVTVSTRIPGGAV